MQPNKLAQPGNGQRSYVTPTDHSPRELPSEKPGGSHEAYETRQSSIRSPSTGIGVLGAGSMHRDLVSCARPHHGQLYLSYRRGLGDIIWHSWVLLVRVLSFASPSMASPDVIIEVSTS